MNNILFFGASSKLGVNWINNLLLENNRIFANIHKNYIPQKKNLFQKKLKLDDQKKLLNYCKKNQISLIINCIGLTNLDLCEKDKKLAKKINCDIPNKICKLSKKLNIKFVHISTDMLFKGLSKKKYTESSKYNPINIYSKTKIEAEKKIKLYCKSLIIRTNFFGFSNKKNMTITDKIISEQKNNQISYLWKDVYFTPIYIKTLIYFTNLLIKKNKSGIYNIVSDEKISKYNFGLMILNRLLIKSRVIPTLFKKNKFTSRPKNMSLSNQKIKNLFFDDAKKFRLKNQIKIFIKDYKQLKNV